MNHDQITKEYKDRAQQWAEHPGLTKIIEVSTRLHGIKTSYEFDVMLTLFLTQNAFPDLDAVADDYEITVDELTVENNFKEPSAEDVMNRLAEKRFSNIEESAKTVVARLFGELDGDPEVDAYMKFRVSEYMKLQTATFQYLTATEKKEDDHDG